MVRATIVALTAAVLACGPGDERSRSRSSVERLPEWRIEELVRIGSLDRPEQALVDVGEVRIGPDGLLYVTQLRDGQIPVYGLDGSLIRTIGRKGEGPGEFRWLVGVGLLGDTLYAMDWAFPRVSLFDLEGRYLSSAV